MILRVTGMDADAVPGAEMVMVPGCDPIVRPPGFTETETAEGAVPDVGERVSHGTLAAAVQDRVPPPLLVTLSVCAVGDAVPKFHEN